MSFSNSFCHLVKVFEAWQAKQLPDATLVVTSPSGRWVSEDPAIG